MQNVDLNRKIDLVLLTGDYLMECGADTSRTTRNLKRLAEFLELPTDRMELYIVYNMVLVTVEEDGVPCTKFKRVNKHGVNLDTIREISNLTREAGALGLSIDEYEKRLKEVYSRKRNYTDWQVTISGGLACGGFCLQFGGDAMAFAYASISAMAGLFLKSWLAKRKVNDYFNFGISTFTSTLVAWMFWLISTYSSIPFFHSSTPTHTLMACALYIIPGVHIMNFVSDMLSGFTQVGLTRAMRSLLILMSMAFGIGLAIQICDIDEFVKTLSMVPHYNYWVYMLAAAISAVGFSMIFNVPRHLLWIIAAGSMLAICTRNLVSLGASNGNIGLDLGPVIGSFVGSAVVSIVYCMVVKKLRTPHQCLSIPSVIPMIPGVLMYRAIFGMFNMHGVIGEVTHASYNGNQAILITLSLFLGVAIPNEFYRRLLS